VRIKTRTGYHTKIQPAKTFDIPVFKQPAALSQSYAIFAFNPIQPISKGATSMLNQLILTGNLGNDPEIFFGSEGDPVTSFSLAFKSGREKTGWIKCVCFNKNAEIAEKYLHSGARIAVVGYLQQSKWKTNEGGTAAASK
jgi:single-strand DNA-binding protein